MKQWLIACIAALVAACGGSSPKPEEVRVVRAIEVGAVADDRPMAFPGEVRSRYEAPLGFRVPGRVVARRVDAGASVRAGQVLAELDPADFAMAASAAAAQLAAARSDEATMAADLARYTDLFGKGFISAAEMERRQSAYAAAQARLGQAEAQAGITANQDRYARLTAPWDGVVTAVIGEVGQVVAAGQPVVALARPGYPEVVIAVPEGRLAGLRDAHGLTVSLWAEPGRRYAARLRELSPAADPVTRTFAARVAIDSADAGVRLGMTATVHVDPGGGGPVALLPVGALLEAGGRPSVWVVGPDGRIAARPITVDGYRDDQVVVTAGLARGERVVTAGVQKLSAGQKVSLATGH